MDWKIWLLKKNGEIYIEECNLGEIIDELSQDRELPS